MADRVKGISASQSAKCGIEHTEVRKCRIATAALAILATIAALAVTVVVFKTAPVWVPIAIAAALFGQIIGTIVAVCKRFFTETTVTPAPSSPKVETRARKKRKAQTPKSPQGSKSPTIVVAPLPMATASIKPPRSKAELNAIKQIKELKKLLKEALTYAKKEPAKALEHINFASSKFVTAASSLLLCSSRFKKDNARIEALSEIFETAHEYVSEAKKEAEIQAFAGLLSDAEVATIAAGRIPNWF